MRNTGLGEAQAGIKFAGRNINDLRYADDLYSRKQRTKEPPDESVRGEWKVGLKLNIQKTKIMASGHITSRQMDGKQLKQWQTLFWGAPKSLLMVTAAIKLKDAYSLEEKLWPM